jgi:ATP-dependent helicase/nuclease subunit A
MSQRLLEPVMTAAYELNGQRVSAEDFYAVACDPRRSVAVEACAGAGKTWMLVSRIVRALLDGVAPPEILAITFTRRAAGEMRERLYQWLAEFAAADRATLLQALRDRGVLIEATPQSPSVLPEQLSNLYRQMLASGRQVQVRTFHSWFAALLRSAPLALLQQMELPADYELLEDDAKPKELVWRRFYAALLLDAEQQADFEAVVFEYGRSQTEKALQTALDKRTEFALADAQGVLARSVPNFSEQCAGFVGLIEPEDFLRAQPQRWQALVDAATALGRADAKTFSAKGAELEAALGAGDLDAAFDALLTQTGTARKFSEKVVGIEQVRVAQGLVLQVLMARQQQAAWRYQQRMARLSRVLLKAYAAVKLERGWIDMNDVERAALLMLSDSVLSGWVQERLDVRVRQLLIDEFQDTNPLQWQALRSWLSGYAGAGSHAPSVFIVGDPKQSIYRFRRAEPQVFKAAQAFVRDALQGDLLSCDHTRRNASGVIAGVNTVMLDAVQADGFEGYRRHTTSSALAGSLYQLTAIARPVANDATDGPAAAGAWRDSLHSPRELPEETLHVLEARQAARWIARQLAPADGVALQPENIMVLARKRSALLPLQDELRRLQIAAQVGDNTELIECCEVQDIVALLDVLVSTQHDLSLAHVLKSPLFGLDDQALVQLALAKNQGSASWFDLLLTSDIVTPDGRPVAACLSRWKAWLDALPPHDALQAIYSDGDVLARFAAAAPGHQRETVLANLRALLGASLQMGGGRFATPYALVRALKAGGVRAPAAVNPQAVRLLTIHGAKGLEAHSVLLLDTDSPPRNADSMTVLVDWPGEAAWPQSFVFLASESQPPASAVALLAAERHERQREELNALYVALTRARHTLAISSIVPHRAAPRSWWQRLTETGLLEVATLAPLPAIAGSATPDVFYLKELPPAPPTASPTVAVIDADPIEARIGKAMHRLLQWGAVSVHGRAAVAHEFDLNPSQALRAAAMASCILQGDGAWVWDPAVIGWAGDEIGISHRGQYRQIDRLVQRRDGAQDGQWWVLDYKTAAAPQAQAELRAQLRDYRDAVQAIYPGQVVRAAFLTAQGAVVEQKDME